MNQNKLDYLLTFEWDMNKETLEIHGNRKGLEKLKSVVESLLAKPDCDHTHLMTNTWGGEELSNKKQCAENEIINHVKIFKWN